MTTEEFEYFAKRTKTELIISCSGQVPNDKEFNEGEAKTLYKKLEEKMKKRIEKFKNEYEYFQTFDIGWSSKKDFYFINATCVNITMKIVFFGILTPQNDELVNKLDKYCRTQIRNQMKKICANGKLSSFERKYISGIEKNRK